MESWHCEGQRSVRGISCACAAAPEGHAKCAAKLARLVCGCLRAARRTLAILAALVAPPRSLARSPRPLACSLPLWLARRLLAAPQQSREGQRAARARPPPPERHSQSRAQFPAAIVGANSIVVGAPCGPLLMASEWAASFARRRVLGRVLRLVLRLVLRPQRAA